MPSGGLRERNKARTRDEIIGAALTLFETTGYDDTTCDDIAAAVGISTRTFFRYFDTKLDVVLAAKDDDDIEGALPELLARRPPEERPIEALRAVLHQTIDRFDVSDSPDVRQYAVMMATPSLRGLQLQHFQEPRPALAADFAPRLGCEPGDLRADVLAAAACAAVQTALERWMRTDRAPGTFKPILDEALDLIEHGFGRR